MIKTPLSNVPLIGDILFFLKLQNLFSFNSVWKDNVKINENSNTFLSAGEMFMTELYLKQPRFTYALVDHKKLKNQRLKMKRSKNSSKQVI